MPLNIVAMTFWGGNNVSQPILYVAATFMTQRQNNVAPTFPQRWIVSLTDGIL